MTWIRAGPVILLVFSISQSFAQAPAQAPERKVQTAEEIVRKFIERFETLNNGLTYEEIETDEYLEDGIVSKKENRVNLVERINGQVFKTLLSQNGQNFKGKKPELKNDPLPINETLLSIYSFTLEGIATNLNRKCWVLSFRPRDDYLEKNDRDKILHRLAGYIWITQNNLDLVSARASLVEPTMILGFLAKINQFDCEVKTQLVSGRSFMGSIHVEARYGQFRIFGYAKKHRIKTITFQNHQRKEE